MKKALIDLLPFPSFGLILICFTFPFILIECNNKELASISGYELAMGYDIQNKMQDSEISKGFNGYLNEWSDSKDDFNSKSNEEDSKDNVSESAYFLWIPISMAIIGFVVGFFFEFRYRNISLIMSSIFGLISLIIFGFVFKFSMNEISAEAGKNFFGMLAMINIQLSYGYYSCLLLFLIIVSFYSFILYSDKYHNEAAIQLDETDKASKLSD